MLSPSTIFSKGPSQGRLMTTPLPQDHTQCPHHKSSLPCYRTFNASFAYFLLSVEHHSEKLLISNSISSRQTHAANHSEVPQCKSCSLVHVPGGGLKVSMFALRGLSCFLGNNMGSTHPSHHQEQACRGPKGTT